MRDYQQAIKVSVSDPVTGEILEERIVSNDYVLITAGNRYLKSVQVMGRTHMLAVAVAKLSQVIPDRTCAEAPAP